MKVLKENNLFHNSKEKIKMLKAFNNENDNKPKNKKIIFKKDIIWKWGNYYSI